MLKLKVRPPMKKYMIIAIGFVLIVIFFAYMGMTKNPIMFSPQELTKEEFSKVWQQASHKERVDLIGTLLQRTWQPNRYTIDDRSLAGTWMEGLSRSEIVTLLGPPDDTDNQGKYGGICLEYDTALTEEISNWAYFKWKITPLAPVQKYTFGMLEIEFDEDGMIRTFRIW